MIDRRVEVRMRDQFKIYIKRQDGVISVFMVFLIPVMIISSVVIYLFLSKYMLENKAYKVSYATSQAYLSTYNAMMFEQYTMFVTYDEDQLQQMLQHYFEVNELTEKLHEDAIEIQFKQLSQPKVFQKVVAESAAVTSGKLLTNFTIDLLNQYKLCDKIREVHDKFSSYEQSLSEQFSLNQLEPYIDGIRGVSDIDRYVKEAKQALSDKYQKYFDIKTAFDDSIEQVKAEFDETEKSLKAICEEKTSQWNDATKLFVDQYTQANDQFDQITIITNQMAPLTAQLDEIQVELTSMEASIGEIEEAIKSEKDKKKKEALTNQLNRLERAFSAKQSEYDATLQKLSQYQVKIAQLCDAIESLYNTNEASGIIETLNQLIAGMDTLLSGVEVKDETLSLKEENWFSHYETLSYSWNLGSIALANEYYMTIFSSYDENCPRKFLQNEENHIIKAEVEYLISGKEQSKDSVFEVRMKIFGIRNLANLVTILSSREKLSQVTSALSFIPQPWKWVATGVAILAWASIESYVDVNELMKGEGFYFFKTDEQWHLDFDAIMSKSWDSSTVTSVTNEPEDKNKSGDENKSSKPNLLDPNLYYLDYLRLILLIQDANVTTLRAMDLLDAQVNLQTKGEKHLKDFSNGHVIDVKWKPLLPFSVQLDSENHLHFENQ